MRFQAAACGALLLSSASGFSPRFQRNKAASTYTSTRLNALVPPPQPPPPPSALQSVTDAISSAVGSIELPPEVTAAFDTLHLSTPDQLSAALDSLVPTLLENPWQFAAVALFASGVAVKSFIDSPDDYSEAPFEPGTDTYDPKAADEFYSQRPLMVAKRLLRLASLTALFNTGVLFDWLVLGKLLKDEEYTALRKNEPRRAKEDSA